MAEKRMFAKTIIDSDAFLDMPLSSQTLYFHLSMRADDDGFINNPKKIQRMIGASDDDMRVLLAKNFLIPFETGIVVIKHWRIHNYIRSDRYKGTTYEEEKSQLLIKENGAYTRVDTIGIPNDNQVTYQLDTQIRVDKDRVVLDKNNKGVSGLFDSVEDDELRQLYLDFYEMRKRMRSPMTDSAVKLLIGKVESLEDSAERQKQLLNEAILNGWKSVYPLKDDSKRKPGSKFTENEREYSKAELKSKLRDPLAEI